MVLVILAVCIGMVVIGAVCAEKRYNEAPGVAMVSFGGIVGIVALVATVFLCCEVSSDARIDDKIAMYTEENAVIEQQIAECVERYQEYEQGVFEKVSPTDAVAFVTLYPELKSDTLVQAQIETYVENNNKIKQLKEKKIDAAVRKWWLYFGG